MKKKMFWNGKNKKKIQLVFNILTTAAVGNGGCSNMQIIPLSMADSKLFSIHNFAYKIPEGS